MKNEGLKRLSNMPKAKIINRRIEILAQTIIIIKNIGYYLNIIYLENTYLAISCVTT
jgi:hypothetical protein